MSHGASLLLLPSTKPTSQVDQGCPTRNLQGWPLLCPPLQLIQCTGPQPLSAKALSTLLSQSQLCHGVSFLLTPHRQGPSFHLQQGPVSPIPQLQGWQFSPYSHHVSPLPTGLDHEHQHHHLHWWPEPAPSRNSSPTTYLPPSLHDAFLHPLVLQVSAKHSLCPPLTSITLQTSVPRLRI